MDKMSAKRVIQADIHSSLAPAFAFPGIQIQYPETVVEALVALYEEYNRAFAPLVELNREWETDYRYCSLNGMPVNYIVQIDMVGLSGNFLHRTAEMSVTEVREMLRSQIFEIENSWAIYHLTRRVLEWENRRSFYDERTQAMLDTLRNRFGLPVALLAVTHAKWEAMMAEEFGKTKEEPLSEAEVLALSGFDKFFGPEEFKQHVRENEGQCKYLLFVRSSDPVDKLKHPEIKVNHPLLNDSEIRRVIKAHALTFNIDNPTWHVGDARRINDTKWYMPSMGMARRITSEEDLRSASVVLGGGLLRAKPAQGTYGCYGHVRGSIEQKSFRYEVRRGLRERGPYLVQPEHDTSTVVNTEDGRVYAFIDRVFCGITENGAEFMGGQREFLPEDSPEVKAGRLHSQPETTYAEIVPA